PSPSTLLPYTTLFRSWRPGPTAQREARAGAHQVPEARRDGRVRQSDADGLGRRVHAPAAARDRGRLPDDLCAADRRLQPVELLRSEEHTSELQSRENL